MVYQESQGVYNMKQKLIGLTSSLLNLAIIGSMAYIYGTHVGAAGAGPLHDPAAIENAIFQALVIK